MRPPSSDAYQAAFDRFLAAENASPAALQQLADNIDIEKAKYVAAKRKWRQAMSRPKSRMRPLARA